MKQPIRIIAFLLPAILPAPVVHAQPLTEPPSIGAAELPSLLKDLRSGGYVLFFRHLDTRLDQEDRQPVDLSDCNAQRNLSDEGRARGRQIGQALKRARVPIGEVLSSPFCRTMETARLVAGLATPDANLFFAIALTDSGKRQKGEALRRMIARPPEKGRNNIIVSHTANLQEAVGLWPKPEGVAYVFRPGADGGMRAVARVPPEVWSAATR